MSKVRLIDSHCHINLLENSEKFEEYSDGMDVLEIFEYDSNLNLNLLKRMKAGGLNIAVGLHPLSARYSLKNEVYDFLHTHIDELNAIGETGIDLYKATNYDEQRELFKMHIECAKKFKKPIIVHCRGDVNIEEILSDLAGTCFVFHCFTYDDVVATKVVKANGYVSFSGIITFKNAEAIRQALKVVPINRILCETDCPFLAPIPYRGQINQPKYVQYVYEECARLLNMDLNEFIEQVTKNFYRFLKNEK
jgi:TatD DNase family protein